MDSKVSDGTFLHISPPASKKFCSSSQGINGNLLDEKLLRVFHGHSLSKFDEEDDSGIKSGDEWELSLAIEHKQDVILS